MRIFIFCLLLTTGNAWSVTGTAISRVCASLAGTNNNGQCIGYIIAIHEMAAFQQKVCLPKLTKSKKVQRPETNEMRHRKMVNVVITYYANNPSIKHEGAPKHIITALSTIWPCDIMTEQKSAKRIKVFPL